MEKIIADFKYTIQTEHAIPNNELEELAEALGSKVTQNRESEGNHHYFFKKPYLTEEDLISLNKLDPDEVVISREEHKYIQENIKTSQGMTWLSTI